MTVTIHDVSVGILVPGSLLIPANFDELIGSGDVDQAHDAMENMLEQIAKDIGAGLAAGDAVRSQTLPRDWVESPEEPGAGLIQISILVETPAEQRRKIADIISSTENAELMWPL
jgi:hypothetical protein